MPVRYTAMFHLYTYDEGIRPLDTRVFIGTLDEALDELKEEFKTFFPDDYDRKDAKFWKERYWNLRNGSMNYASVSGRDLKGYRRFKIERSSHLQEENDD